MYVEPLKCAVTKEKIDQLTCSAIIADEWKNDARNPNAKSGGH